MYEYKYHKPLSLLSTLMWDIATASLLDIFSEFREETFVIVGMRQELPDSINSLYSDSSSGSSYIKIYHLQKKKK